jgi:hypothetical protein
MRFGGGERLSRRFAPRNDVFLIDPSTALCFGRDDILGGRKFKKFILVLPSRPEKIRAKLHAIEMAGTDRRPGI